MNELDPLLYLLVHGEPEQLRFQLKREQESLALFRAELAPGPFMNAEALAAKHQDFMTPLCEELVWKLAMTGSMFPEDDILKFGILSEHMGAPWFCVVREGRSLLEQMIMIGHLDLVQEILNECKKLPNAVQHPLKLKANNPLIPALERRVPFHMFRQMVEIMGKSVDEVGRKSGITPLLFLVWSTDVLLQDETVMRNSDCLCEMLVKFGANPMRKNKAKQRVTTPFHSAAHRKNLRMANIFFKAFAERPPSKTEANVKDSNGATVLHLLVKNGWFEMAEAFVGLGASILSVDKKKECPLVDLIKSRENRKDPLVQAIISEWKPQDIVTALSLDLSTDHQQLVNAFAEKHAHDVLQSDMDPQSQKKLEITYQVAVDRQCPLAVKILKDNCKGLESFQCELHRIIGDAPQNLDFIRTVVQLGAKVNSQDTSAANGGAHIIHRAIATESIEAVKFLLENGVSLDVVDFEGNTPLHVACKVKDPAKRKELVSLVASQAPGLIDVKNEDGYSPGKSGNKSLRRLLSGIKAKCKEQEEVGSVGAEPSVGPVVNQEVEHVVKEAEAEKKEQPVSEDRMQGAGHQACLPSVQKPEEKEAADTPSDQPASSSSPPKTPVKQKKEETVEPPSKAVSVMETLVPAWEPRNIRDRKLKMAIEGAEDFIQKAEELARERQEAVENEATDSDSEEVRAGLREVMGEVGEPGDGGNYVGEGMDEHQADDGIELEEGEERNEYALPDSLLWGMQITKEARDGWAAMDEHNRRKVWKLLCQIGQGKWQLPGGGKAVRLNFQDKQLQSVEMWKIKINYSGRIVFEICVDFDEGKGQYMDIVRVWVVTLIHKRYEKALLRIKDSYEHSGCILWKPKLLPISTEVPYTDRILKPRIPRQYEILDGGMTRANGEISPGKDEKRVQSAGEEVPVELKVPTNAGDDTFNLLKFHTIGSAMVKCILDGLGDRNVDFPFKVSPAEKEIIEMCPTSPKSIILVGRSGTGKTTCAVYRMWAQWLASQNHREDPYHQIFLTASATLKEQVEKTFRKLQAAVLSKAQLQEVIDLGKNSYQFRPFRDIPSAAFPLFLTTHQFLRMLDGTLKDPFFPRKEDGTLLHDSGDDVLDDLDGMGLLVALEDSDVEEDEVPGEADLDGCEGGVEAREKLHSPAKKSRQRVHLTYNIFEQQVWPKISNRSDFKDLMPSLVLQEILSYIKGSLEALQCKEGHLPLEDYLKVGKKRAPNYSQDLRVKVYEVFLKYKKVMKESWLYDTTDLVGHIYRQIVRDGYKGTKIHNIFRDEVQDFTQAELLLDLRIASDPNGLFYCGDTCQTISRGVGFRFDDIGTLFFEEAAMHKQKVGRPHIKNLLINYRTHSGILNVACSIVDVLANYFPQFMDKLPRESAFFKGPEPYLMENTEPQDILNLVIASGSASDSEVQFGAHQAILVRNKDGFEHLPKMIQESALILTIPQAKGLEFDDVFIVDFFRDSPASSREWRVLMSYLEDKEREGGALAPFDFTRLEKTMQGYLRCEKFDGSRHILLCEELKHLYTAVTRAKSNLVFFDSHPEKRAPFFHFLQRLGLAKLMTKAGSKESTLVLSKPASKPEDWVARGKNFMDNRSFELALRCFESAKDPVWSLVAHAQVLIQKAGTERSEKERKRVFTEAGYKLMMACSNFNKAIEVDGKTVKRWMLRASVAFSRSSELVQAADILRKLDLLRKAKDMYIRAKDFDTAADICEKLGLLAEACRLHVCKGNKKKNYSKAFRILNGPRQVPVDVATKQRIADITFYDSQRKGDNGMMHSACKHMAAEKRHTLLSELGEFNVLAEHLEPFEAAQLLMSLGRFQEAAKKMGDENDFTEVDQWRTLLDCLLKIGTPEAFSRAYDLCSRGELSPLSIASRAKTTLAEAAAFSRDGGNAGDEERLRENLREAYGFFLEKKNVVGQIECLSRLLTMGATGDRNELERLQVDVRPLCSVLVDSMTALLTHTYSNVGTRALHQLQCHFNICGLSDRIDTISYRITNVRFLEALRQGGLTPAPISKGAKPTPWRQINFKSCKAAIAVDFYNHARVVFFNLLQLLHKGVVQRSADMNSEETLNMKETRSATLTLMEKERVEFLAKGLLICSSLRSVLTLCQSLPNEFRKQGRRMSADYRTFQNLCMERQWRGLLGAKWSGYSTMRSIKFSKEWFIDAKRICEEVWKDSSDLWGVRSPIRCFHRDISPVLAVVDPNLSLWHLRRFLGLREFDFGTIFRSMNELGWTFSRQRRGKNLDPVPCSDVKIDVRKQMWRSPKSDVSRILQVDGHFLAYALRSFLRYDGTAFMAFQNLNRFTGRCAYFESSMTPVERPRLCVEGFLELLEWQTVLLLPGFCEECVLPRHIVASMEEAYNGKSIQDYIFNHWHSTKSNDQNPYVGYAMEPEHQKSLSAKRGLAKLVPMMWYFVTQVLPQGSRTAERAVSMEQHLSRLLARRLPLHVDAARLPEVEPVSDWTLPHVQNCKRAVALIACTLLAVATEAVRAKDAFTTRYLPPLVACLKKIDVPGKDVKVAKMLENAAWTPNMLIESLQRTCADLQVGIASLTKNGMQTPIKVYNVFETFVSPKAKLQNTKVYMTDIDEKRAREARLYDIPEESALFILQASQLGSVLKGPRSPANIIQEAWKEYSKFIKGVREKRGTKWHKRFSRWHQRAKATLKKNKALSDIDASREAGYGDFKDPGKRLHWVHVGLDFQPLCRDVCTVCPKGDGGMEGGVADEGDSCGKHSSSEEHQEHFDAFKRYEKVQSHLAALMENLASFGADCEEVKKMYSEDPDVVVRLMDLSREVSTEELEKTCLTMEEGRVWTEREKVKDCIYKLRDELKRCKEELNEIKEERKQEESKEVDMHPDVDYQEEDEHDEGDFTLVARKEKKQGSKKKKKNNHMKRSKKGARH